jgi:hypothetical protein
VGALLAVPILLGICAPLVIFVWMVMLEPTHWKTALLPAGAVLSSDVAVFLLTWWLGQPEARNFVATEYGVWAD